MKNKHEVVRDYVKIIANRKGEDYEVLVSEQDFLLVSSFGGTWSVDNRGYVRRTINKKLDLMHRLIMEPAEGMIVDHINGNTLDNRRENLRVLKPSENQQNIIKHQKASETGFKGVSKEKRWGDRYRARINKFGKEVSLGYYDEEYDAQIAAIVGRILYHPHSREKAIYDKLKSELR